MLEIDQREYNQIGKSIEDIKKNFIEDEILFHKRIEKLKTEHYAMSLFLNKVMNDIEIIKKIFLLDINNDNKLNTIQEKIDDLDSFLCLYKNKKD